MALKKDSALGTATALTAADFFRIVKDKTGTPASQIIGWGVVLSELQSDLPAGTASAGVAQLATSTEINAGTVTNKVMSPDQFVASNRNLRYINWRVLDATTDWPANATLKQGGDFEFPFAGTIVEIGAYTDTAGTTGTAIVDVNINGNTIMGTAKLSLDTAEKTTRTAAVPPVLTTTAVAVADIFTTDIDQNFTTKAKGLTIRFGVRQT